MGLRAPSHNWWMDALTPGSGLRGGVVTLTRALRIALTPASPPLSHFRGEGSWEERV